MEKRENLMTIAHTMVNIECECGGLMKETDQVTKTHTCGKCGKQEIYSKSYPFIQHYDGRNHEWI